MDLVFLPGMLFDERLWQPVMDELSDDYDCRFIDLKSSPSLTDMFEKINQSCPQKMNLIGFSMGGYVALEYALLNPDKINKLIIVGYSPFGFDEARQAYLKQSLQQAEKHGFMGITDKMMPMFVHDSQLKNSKLTHLVKSMTAESGTKVYLRQQTATLNRQNRLQELKKLNLPVYLIAAKQDKQVKYQEILQCESYIQQGKIFILEQCGHMIPLEKTEELTQILRLALSKA